MADLSYGFNLPDYGNPVQALQQAGAAKERNQYRQDALADKHALQKEKKDADNLKFIEGLDLPAIGNNTVDELTHNMIGGVKEELYQLAKGGASMAELQYAAQNKFSPIIQGHTLAKNKFDQINKGVQELGKQFKDGNLEKAREIATIPFLKNHVKFDANGKAVGYNEQVPDKNYTDELSSFDNLPEWNSQSGKMAKYLGGLGKTAIGDSDYKGNKGQVISHSYSGHRSLFSEPELDGNGKVIGERVKVEKQQIGHDANGQPISIDVLPEEAYKNFIADPEAMAEFAGRYKERKQQMAKSNTPITPDIEDISKRKLAYEILNEAKGALDGHSYIQKEKTVVPKEARVNVNINNGDGVAKKKQDDFDLVASLARTFSNPKSINVDNLTPTKVKDFDEPLYDVTGVFQNLKVRSTKEYDSSGKQTDKDVHLDGLYVDPKNNNMVFRFPSKDDAEHVMGIKLKDGNDGLVIIGSDQKKAMRVAINSLATAYHFKENERKRLMEMVGGKSGDSPKAAAQPQSVPAKTSKAAPKLKKGAFDDIQ